MAVVLVNGDALSIPLADESVHCVVTSPPYWGLRDYNVIDQLGLEPTPEDFVTNMVAVFREVRRVLREDGTLWLNLGDSYAGSGGPGSQYDNKAAPKYRDGFTKYDNPNRSIANLKPKDLVGIPWRVALALQADGWWLRSDIIWHKPNPMPESVTDRPTKAHEYLFLLSKSSRYFYDADAVREENSPGTFDRYKPGEKIPEHRKFGGSDRANHDFLEGQVFQANGRNRRSVWTIATAPYSGAHFATFPPALVEPCIKAGSSEHGVCPVCGAQWERVTSKATGGAIGKSWGNHSQDATKGNFKIVSSDGYRPGFTTGFRPTCAHDAQPVPATVFDPFAGSGTTLQVARQLGRHCVGLDLSYAYLHGQARARLELDALDDWQFGKNGHHQARLEDLPLFAELPDAAA